MGRLRFLFLLAGLIAGALWALPLDDVRGECPPAGEGLGWCAFQKSWAPGAGLLLTPVLLASVFVTFAFDVVPEVRRRWRAGYRPVHMTRRQEAPPYREDPFLLAASWGERSGLDETKPKVEPTDFVGRGRATRGT